MSEKQLQVLYVEDDEEMAKSLAMALKRYDITLTAAGSYHRAWQLIQTRCFDLYLIDVFLKDGSGFDLCREIREYERTPVIFLTSAVGEPEQIRGYEIGGDAYVSKPFTIESLMARVHAVMRRQQWQNTRLPVITRFGSLEIDFSRMSVWRKGENIPLTKMQFRILQLLVENAQTVVLRDAICNFLWEERGVIMEQNTLNVHVSNLKKALKDEGSCIETVHNIGYRWNQPVTKGEMRAEPSAAGS